MNNIRVFLVDDHPVVRAGLRAMLGDLEGITVVATLLSARFFRWE